MLEALREVERVESHLVVSASGYLTVSTETGMKKSQLEALADVVHDDRNVGASIASGSFPSLAMIIAPCSMKTLGCIAQGIGSSLMTRSADVILKERRRLILLARETPLILAQFRNLEAVTEKVWIVYQPVPAFFSYSPDIDTMVRETVGRVLNLAGIDNALYEPWQGLGSN